MMPHLWTLQTQYLASHPVQLSTAAVILLVVGFATGWTLNHVANDQKNMSRRTEGKFRIAGQEVETIEAKYQTADGKVHRTVLLCSGKSSLARQITQSTAHVLTSRRTVGNCSSRELCWEHHLHMGLVYGLWQWPPTALHRGDPRHRHVHSPLFPRRGEMQNQVWASMGRVLSACQVASGPWSFLSWKIGKCASNLYCFFRHSGQTFSASSSARSKLLVGSPR
jgi:7-dehydrocholesterol reductase